MNELSAIDTEDFLLSARGDRAMQGRWANTQASIGRMEHLNSLWQRSNTSWSLDHLTVNASCSTPWRQLRQVSAEIERKKMALSEAKWGLLRLDAEIKKAKISAEAEKNPIDRDLILIEIGEKEDRISFILQKFSGAMLDVADLERNYNRLMKEIGGEITEDRIDAAEVKSHLTRAIRQSIWSVRYSGVIDPGNQEYLEQIGVNPSMVLFSIREYIKKEAEDVTGKAIVDNFVKNIIEKLSSSIKLIGD
jgi:hypothetical protein